MRNPLDKQSLRQRLLWAVLVAVAGVIALLGVAMQAAIEHSSATEFDERLAQQARVILAYADHEFAETGSVVPETADNPGVKRLHEVIYQVWTVSGKAVHRSEGAPPEPLVTIGSRGFTEVRFADEEWRVYSLASSDMPLVVQVAELSSHRSLIASRARQAIRTPLLLSLPLLAALVWWLTTAALQPVEKLARDIGRRSAAEIAPLDLGRVPTELHGIGTELNALLARHREALSREQRFTADAAHELRTPLSAVRAQAQVAMRAQQAPEREHALQQLIAGVDRTGRLVTQLLSLARLEPANAPTLTACRNIESVLDDVLHDLQHDIDRHAVTIDVRRPLPATAVPEEPVYLLLRNLLDNAIRHSPAGGRILVEVNQSGGVLAIRIADRGPGIPVEHREAALDRFRRFSDLYSGSGLGLSIVKRVVELLHGTLELGDAEPAPGLEVRISLPAQPGP
jgi:two-component system sensor histidine kinase QseC